MWRQIRPKCLIRFEGYTMRQHGEQIKRKCTSLYENMGMNFTQNGGKFHLKPHKEFKT